MTANPVPQQAQESRPIRVCVVDDDAFALRALRSYLDPAPQVEVLSTFTSGAEALAFLRKVRCDVVVTDVRMPGMDGLELLTRVKQEMPSTAVIMLTSFDDDSAMLTALAERASGFLLKDASPQEVVQAVTAAHEGGTTLSPSVTSRLVTQHLRPVSTAPRAQLTQAESEVLSLLRKGCSNSEIAESLHIAQSTVKAHVSHLMTKYNVSSRLKLVVAVYEEENLLR